MRIEETLQQMRREHGYSQEQLADALGVARQTVSKWETGQAVPELGGLIALSELYGVTIDRLVKEEPCAGTMQKKGEPDVPALTAFLLRAKRHTYAGGGHETAPSRTASHDLAYEEGEYAYYDTYLGGERFAGQEAVWRGGAPLWCMNYAGRVLGDNFSGDFLKEALYRVLPDIPFRGPRRYSRGDYHYHCSVEGSFAWYQGTEEIFYRDEKIYECRFHGGSIR